MLTPFPFQWFDNASDPRLHDIIGVLRLPPITFEEFRKRQETFVLNGYRVEYDGLTAPEIGGGCPCCGSRLRFTLEFIRDGEAAMTFDICITCWSACEEVYIYAKHGWKGRHD